MLEDVLLSVVLLLVVCDLAIGGIVLFVFSRLLRFGGWYRGKLLGESIVFDEVGGARFRGWLLSGLIRVVVSDKRVMLRVLWSRFILIEVPIPQITSVRSGRLWWYRTVVVLFESDRHDERVDIFGGSRKRERLLAVFREVGVPVGGGEK